MLQTSKIFRFGHVVVAFQTLSLPFTKRQSKQKDDNEFNHSFAED
jgi:hypothetical protein